MGGLGAKASTDQPDTSPAERLDDLGQGFDHAAHIAFACRSLDDTYSPVSSAR
jgi:hypothetical protein